jgi:U3 small nucleolar RNA-associated protein MPP10
MNEPSETIESFLELLAAPEDLGATRLYENEGDPVVASTLRATCQLLWHRLQVLSDLHHQARRKAPKPLSDLPSLVIAVDDSENEGVPDFQDAETIWGQISHVQAGPLRALLKKSVKRLEMASSSPSDAPRKGKNRIVLLDTTEMDGQDDDDVESCSSPGEANHRLGRDHVSEDRIRERMMRVMDDMERDSDGEDDDDDDDEKKTLIVSADGDGGEEDSMLDPAVQQLNDGIFDIHEMEAFADEEEEYLPDDAFGPEKPELGPGAIDRRSLHARLRDGDVPTGEDDDDDEDGDGLIYRTEAQRRRKYRDDEDIEALDKLYETPQEDDDEDEPVDMTAAEMFGQPNPKYFHKWKRRNHVEAEYDGDNSWNDYSPERGKSKETAGWNIDDDSRGSHQLPTLASEHLESTSRGGDAKAGRGSLKKRDPKRAREASVDKLALQTQLLERELLFEKPWQMKGEATSTSRPLNSLLESTPEFEVATKLAPTVTIEHTESVEETITRRILNEDWDDVIPRELPDVGWHLKRKEAPEVSQEKSKLSLGELYERVYLKKAVGYDVDATEKETELDKKKSEIRCLFANLCSKLDALSNYHFAPRPVAEEAEVRVLSKPAIAMEEALPLHVSEARASAPQEIFATKRGREGILRTDPELEQADRKRLRSAKKAARRKSRQAKLADERLLSRLQPGLGLNNPYEKRKVRQELEAARAVGRVTTGATDTNANYGDSGTFFKRLQEEAEKTVRGEKPDSDKKKPRARNGSSSIKL